MKKIFYVIGVLIILAIAYIVANFFLFDDWATHSAEKQLNQYVKHEDAKKLKKVAKDNSTYHFLKSQKHISVDKQADNQGSGHIGYYRVEVNGQPAMLEMEIKHGFLPEIPKIKSVQLDNE
ncbi:hypothetical protein [Staphylococcus pettenkoferi]|uniref:YdgA family protein n=1 Tax=Staphylococcus pettenkoferi TaxID=170573 RepID=A0A9Q4D573_9STAP|nr:hypothetical protein [Staphylococcus pettenkoferi]MCY1569284.1 YdgA family protein [Staphylococcus pettenkoferi]MCY1576165.1 YdgA family protein [Staphylococcus pettenkoferi]MCY1593957.1 YdgA family protein [Staphylococcus pettenkoferi]MCY1617444.1 YdgA family protein [Staphylococcus pettenkoferi]